jgi:hypothetical protein
MVTRTATSTLVMTAAAELMAAPVKTTAAMVAGVDTSVDALVLHIF